MEKNKRNLLFGILALNVLLLLVLLVIIYQNKPISPPNTAYTPSSSTRKYLSESTQRKIFYDMIATQDQHPYSNEWNQGVKQAAADHYNVPMSKISDIIQKGATEGWLQPNPP